MNQQWNCHWCYMRVVSLQKLPQTAHKPQQTTNPPLCNKLIKSNSYRLLLETTVIFTQKLVTFWQQMSPFSSWELFAESSRSSQTWESNPLVSVHDVLGFLPDSDGLPDPPCCPIKFPADNCRLFPSSQSIMSHVYDNLLLSAATTTATPTGEFSVQKRRHFLPKRH